MAKEKIVVAGEMYESITGQLFEIGRQLRQPNGYPFDPEKLKKHLQDAIEGKFDGVASAFPVVVNYDQSVEVAVKAGKYGWSNSDITTKHFPSQRKGTAEIEIILVHFNRAIESDEAVRELDKQGLRPAELPELLAFGAKYPDVQREFPVIALGSVWQDPAGNRHCASLRGDSGKRYLHLFWFDFRWIGRCRFAALRK